MKTFPISQGYVFYRVRTRLFFVFFFKKRILLIPLCTPSSGNSVHACWVCISDRLFCIGVCWFCKRGCWVCFNLVCFVFSMFLKTSRSFCINVSFTLSDAHSELQNYLIEIVSNNFKNLWNIFTHGFVASAWVLFQKTQEHLCLQ